MSKYVFFESFMYKTNSSTYRTHTQIVNRVTVYVHPQRSLIERLTRCGHKYNTRSDKLYVRERVRKARVFYTNQQKFNNPQLTESCSENYILGIFTDKTVDTQP